MGVLVVEQPVDVSVLVAEPQVVVGILVYETVLVDFLVEKAREAGQEDVSVGLVGGLVHKLET